MEQQSKELDPPVVQEDVGIYVFMGVAAGDGYGGRWGKGATEDVAKRNFRKAGGSLTRGYTVYKFDEVTEFMGITGMGYIEWRIIDGSEPADHMPDKREVEPTEKKVRA